VYHQRAGEIAMNYHTSICFLTGLLFLLVTGSLSATAQSPVAEANKSVRSDERGPLRDYRVGAGDVLLIEVAGEPDLKRRVKISEQGAIRLPYIERDLKVEGLSETGIASLLRREYLSILKQPEVTVYIEEYAARVASIVGAVNKSRRVPLTREMRVFDLISEGGGLAEKAGNIIQLIHTRPAEGKSVDGSDGNVIAENVEFIDLRDLVRRPELNRIIRDGDVLNVPETGVIYVTGSVNKPGMFAMREQIRLTQAIAMAGGVAQDSKKKEVQLIRTTDPNTQTKVAKVINLLEVEKNPDKDILLQPYDVVLVPEATQAKTTRTLIQAFVGGLANAAGWGILR
jgi:polysaccharide export outer membrane protein